MTTLTATEHDCYTEPDYSVQEFLSYQPSYDQIDNGTDRDEKQYIAVCNTCGEDMPDQDIDC